MTMTKQLKICIFVRLDNTLYLTYKLLLHYTNILQISLAVISGLKDRTLSKCYRVFDKNNYRQLILNRTGRYTVECF